MSMLIQEDKFKKTYYAENIHEEELSSELTANSSDVQGADVLAEIVNDVELRLIQEEINKTWQEHNLMDSNRWVNYLKKSKDLFSLGSVAVTSLSLFVPFTYFYMDVPLKVSVSSSALVLLGFVGSMLLDNYFNFEFDVRKSKKDKVKHVNNLRKKLAQQTLGGEIGKPVEDLNGEWQTVTVIQDDNFAKQYLVRVQKNLETGFEFIEKREVIK